MIRDMQIKLAKKNGTFEPPVRLTKGVVAQKKDITVQDFFEEYVTIYGLKKWGNSFYSSNVGLIKNYINPYIGERYVRSMTTKDIDDYYTFLLEQPAVVVSGHHDTGARITAYTVSKIHKLLKSAFGKAVAWQYASVNPTHGATLPEAKSSKRDVWSDAEAIAALNVCNTQPLQICLYLALGCSMRLGEILGLQWRNVHMNIEEACLCVDRELS
jgi:integrase